MESKLHIFSEEAMRIVILPSLVTFILALIFEYIRVKQAENRRIAVKGVMLSLGRELQRENEGIMSFISSISRDAKRIRWRYRLTEMNKDFVKHFSALSGQNDAVLCGKEAESSLSTIERRQEIRHECDIPVEFVLNDGPDQTVKGVILNFSDSGLCVNSSVPLKRGQGIFIMGSQGSVPTRHQAFTVQWSSEHMAGFLNSIIKK